MTSNMNTSIKLYTEADCQYKKATCWENCCLSLKIINFQKCFLAAKNIGSSDRHFRYILDLTDKMFIKWATM